MKNRFGKWAYYEAFNAAYHWKKRLGKNIFTQWLYMIFPFAFTTLLFVMSYFLGGIYPLWVKECVTVLEKYVSNIKVALMLKKVTIVTHLGMFVSYLLAFIGCPFAIVANKQNMGWMTVISDVTYLVYFIYLMLAWYFSCCLLCYALTGIYVTRTLLRDKSFNLFKKNYDEIIMDNINYERILILT